MSYFLCYSWSVVRSKLTLIAVNAEGFKTKKKKLPQNQEVNRFLNSCGMILKMKFLAKTKHFFVVFENENL